MSCKIRFIFYYMVKIYKQKTLNYGRNMEQYAINKFEIKYGLKVSPAVLCVGPEISYLAESPDQIL